MEQRHSPAGRGPEGDGTRGGVPAPRVPGDYSPWRGTLLYLLFGITWIIASDYVAGHLGAGAWGLDTIQTAKGLLYIGATATLVYWLLRKACARSHALREAEALNARKHTLEKILGSLGEAVVIVDPERRTIVQCNPATERLFGYGEHELVGQSTRIIHVDEESQRVFGEVSEATLSQGKPFHTEYQLKKRDGAILDVEITVQSLEDDPGWERGVVSIIHDITPRKQSERTLRESEVRFRQLVELLPVAVCVSDSAGTILHHNRAAVGLWGQEPVPGTDSAHICGSHRMHLPDGAPLPKDECPQAITLRSAQPVRDTEIIFERPDGSRSQAIVNTVPLTDATGSLTGAVSTLLDITELRAAETAAREAEKATRDIHARLEQLAQRLPDAVYLKDRELRYTLINEAGAAFVGKAPEDIIGQDDHQLFAPETTARIIQSDRAIMESGEVQTLEEETTDQRGMTRFFLATKGALYTSEGAINGLFGISRDITESKMLRAALEERMRELSTLYRATRCLLDTDKPLEARLEDLVALLPAGWLFPERSRARVVFEGQTFATPGFEETPWVQTSLIHCLGRVAGRLDIALTEESPERDEGPFLAEERELIDSVARTVGEAAGRLKLEEQYRQAQKMESIGRLAGGIAHDFNNIMAAIMGYAESVLTDLDAASPLHDDVDQIYRAARRASELTQQLLAFSRQDVAAPSLLDLNDAIEELVSMLGRLLTEDITLEWAPCPEPPVVHIGSAQLQQVLVNLLVNARDAMDGGGSIHISVRIETLTDPETARTEAVELGDYVVLEVRDTGSGMDEETLKRAFDPFFTTKAQGKGTGLGLATVYGIVKQNRGFIQVRSAPGVGTAFAINLPRQMDSVVPEELAPPETPRKSGGETILLVEDEVQLLQLNTRAIKSLGYTVLSTDSPREAIAIARERGSAIDLLITDIVMPEMNGRELQQELNRHYPTVKCLFTSGYTSDIIADRGVLEENVHFLSKPFTRAALAAKIREVLDSGS